MAAIDIDAVVNEAVEKALAKSKHNLRLLQEQAWSDGYQACKRGTQEFRNPFRPESSDDEVLDRANLG